MTPGTASRRRRQRLGRPRPVRRSRRAAPPSGVGGASRSIDPADAASSPGRPNAIELERDRRAILARRRLFDGRDDEETVRRLRDDLLARLRTARRPSPASRPARSGPRRRRRGRGGRASSKGSSRRPSSRAACSVDGEVAMHTMLEPRAPRAREGSRRRSSLCRGRLPSRPPRAGLRPRPRAAFRRRSPTGIL